jgi:tetratricopeptide (TPR) repeat protein
MSSPRFVSVMEYTTPGMTFFIYFCRMNPKTLFSLFSLITILSLASCSSDPAKTELKEIDAAAVAKASAAPPALAKLNAEVTADPENPEVYHKRAQYYLKESMFDEGFEDMREVMTRDSTKALYFITLSDLYFMTNQTGASKATLEKCLQLDDKNVDAMLKLAELHFYVKKHDKSLEYINSALKLDKYNSKAYFMRGMNYKELKDTAKAISSMQTAVEQDQRFYNAYMQLGILNAAQRKPIAVEYYKNALRIQPNSIETWYDIGKYYQDVENWPKAEEAYGVLLQLDAKNRNGNYNLGVICMAAKKDYKKALNYFSTALSTDPTYAEGYYARGTCYQLLGDKKNAATDFNACLAINPQFELATIALKQVKIEN